MNRKDYPPHWHEIAQRIKVKANWTCRKCKRKPSGKPGDVLTVHHRNGDVTNNRDTNLIALCQGCHLLEQLKLNTFQIRKQKEHLGQIPIYPPAITEQLPPSHQDNK